ncbi:MAG TPA: CoA-transferase [Chloroflexota bacterium]|nr:CoA-transferase [Chloroflexota bacterium]
MPDKLCTMREAVARLVPDGASVVMGTALESLIPFAAGHELIRQRRRDLTLVGPISDMLFDQLIGAGCAARVIAAWVGNVSAGLGHNYRRAAEHGIPRPLAIVDHSNYTLALALLAGAHGVPYLPTRSTLGSNLLDSNPTLRVVRGQGSGAGSQGPDEGPFASEPLVLVPALEPDVAILQVQRADADGNAHAWGNLGVTREAGLASQRVILVAEEIVPREVILSDPNRVLLPGFRVDAVVHEPFGAHPSPVQGYYGRDNAYFDEYHAATRTPEGFASWLATWVEGVPDRAGYLARLGEARRQALLPREHRYAAPVDYGY